MTNVLTIGRLSNVYVVPASHPAPEQVRARLDDMVRTRLASECGHWLGSALDESDESVWLIRKLDLDLVMDAGAASLDLLARHYARQLAERLLRTVAAGADGVNVLRFANRAEYIAWLLDRLARGVPRSEWAMLGLDGFASLPAGAGVRALLLREPARITEVLAVLARSGRLEHVLEVLSNADAAALLDALPPAPAWSLRDAVAGWEPRMRSAPRDVLRLAVKSAFRAPPAILRTMLELFTALGSHRAIAALASSGDFSACVAQLRSVDVGAAQSLETLIAAAPAEADCLAEAASRLVAAARVAPGPMWMTCEFAAIYLLAPAFEATLDPEMLADPLSRLVIAAKCFGGVRAQLALADSGLAFALGLERPPEPETISAHRVPARARELSEKDAESLSMLAIADEATDCALSLDALAVMRAFARRLPGFAESSIAFLRANFLEGAGAVRVIDDQVDVELPGVPLRLVLRLIGIDGDRYTLPWLPGRTIQLRLPVE